MRVIDLFSGAGGLSLGLSRAGFDIELGVDADASACSVYRRIHPETEVWNEQVDAKRFRSLRDEIAVVAAGPPCQPFSSAGKRLGRKDPRDGFPVLIDTIKAIAPEAVVIENVVGITSGPRRKYLAALIAELHQLRYIVVSRVLDAADYGVPQHRRRVFIVATRDRPFSFPAATHGLGKRRPWKACGPPIASPRPVGDVENLSPVIYAKRPHVRPSPFSGLLFNGSGRPLRLDSPAPTVLACAGGNKTHFVDQQSVVPAYHQHLRRGGKPRQGNLDGAVRLTPAQCARLQTLPAWPFRGAPATRYRLIGNAVPPRLAGAVGSALFGHLAETA